MHSTATTYPSSSLLAGLGYDGKNPFYRIPAKLINRHHKTASVAFKTFIILAFLGYGIFKKKEKPKTEGLCRIISQYPGRFLFYLIVSS